MQPISFGSSEESYQHSSHDSSCPCTFYDANTGVHMVVSINKGEPNIYIYIYTPNTPVLLKARSVRGLPLSCEAFQLFSTFSHWVPRSFANVAEIMIPSVVLRLYAAVIH